MPQIQLYIQFIELSKRKEEVNKPVSRMLHVNLPCTQKDCNRILGCNYWRVRQWTESVDRAVRKWREDRRRIEEIELGLTLRLPRFHIRFCMYIKWLSPYRGFNTLLLGRETITMVMKRMVHLGDGYQWPLPLEPLVRFQLLRKQCGKCMVR